MIKLNLLPSYYYEVGRIRTTLIVFAILFVLEAALVFLAQDGFKKQEAWYTNDQTKRCEPRKTEMDAYVAQAETLKTKSASYDPWISLFGDLQPAKAYNEGVASSWIKVAEKLGGSGSWYTEITLQKDGAVSATGNIKGSMQFLSYYFRLKDAGFTLEPAVKVYPAATLSQRVDLKVSGKVDALPQPFTFPSTGTPAAWGDLYKAAGDAAGGATPAGKLPPGTPPTARPTTAAPAGGGAAVPPAPKPATAPPAAGTTR